MKKTLCLSLILVFAAISQASLYIDFGNPDSPVADGYEAYTARHEQAGDFIGKDYDAFGATITVTPSWAPDAVAAVMQMLDRGTGDGYEETDPVNKFALMRDWIGSDTRSAGDPLTITLSGLPAGSYLWKSYHHDTEASNVHLFDVTVNDAAAAGQASFMDVDISGSADTTTIDGVATFSAILVSDGSDISLVFDQHPWTQEWNQPWFIMNGFDLTPNPYPYDPYVEPVFEDGTVGNVVKVGDEWQVQDIVLSYTAAPDPNAEVTGFPMNPNIFEHVIYIREAGADDPNFYTCYRDEVGEITTASDPVVVSDPIASDMLTQATVYEWMAVDILIDPNTGTAYDDDDPNNLKSDIWTFTTANAIPEVTVNPEHTNSLLDGTATLSIETGPVADGAVWYRVNGVMDVFNAETGEWGPAEDDVADEVVNDGADSSGLDYAGAGTKVLTITGMKSDGSTDASYYAFACNGDTLSEEPSTAAWVWYPRMTNYYTFDTADFISGENTVKNMADGGGYDLVLKSHDSGLDTPVLAEQVLAQGSTDSLFFNNPRGDADPNSVNGQYGEFGAAPSTPGNNASMAAYKEITISAWVYWNGGESWQRIVDFGNSQDFHMNFQLNPGWPATTPDSLQFEVIVDGDDEARVFAPANAIPADEWTHVAVTLEGQTAKLYVDGEFVAEDTSFAHAPIDLGSTADHYMSYSQYGGDWFNGYVDELKIWNYPLTVVQIAQDYLADDLSAGYVCNVEEYALDPYDVNHNCLIDLGDFAALAARWLESDRITLDN